MVLRRDISRGISFLGMEKTMKMKADFVLIEPLKWNVVKRGRILLPDNSDEKKMFAHGRVTEVGPGLWLQSGVQCKVEVDVGDRVLYYQAGAKEIEVGKVSMRLISEPQIIAVLEDGDFDFEQETDNATA